MKRENSLQVVPDVVYFRDLKQGETDSVDVWVMNVGKNPVQIRCSLPKGSPFVLATTPPPTTAPGLETKVTLNYTSKKSEVVKSTLFVDCQGTHIEIPVVACPPCSRITVDTQKIDLGQVGVSSNCKFTFTLSNMGVAEGSYDISCDNNHFEILQPKGKIMPMKSVEINCSFTPPKVKDYKATIKIDNHNAFEPIDPITVTASAVQHSLALCIEDKEVNTIDFGTIFFGQKRVINATIVNRGPYKRSFVVLPPKDAHGSTPRGDEEPEEEIFSAVPAEGLLNGHESMVVRFVFNPISDGKIHEDEIETFFNHFSSIEVVETHQKLDFQLEGKAVQHNISMSSVDFNFEKIVLKEKAVQTLTIHNLSKYLPISYEIKQVAHFRFEPTKGTVKPGSTKDVSIVFYPKNLGVFETSTVVTFCSGLLKRKINLVGSCGNNKKEFDRKPVYERDEKARFNAMHPDSRFAYDLNEIKKREARRKEFDSYLSNAEEERARIEQRRAMKSKLRKKAITTLANNGMEYTEEDIQEFIRREIEKQSEEQESDFGIVDNGLTPPEPSLSKRPAPLYLEKPEKFGLMSHTGSNQSALRNRPTEKFDENVVIKKKFKSKATTPSEINESTKPLTPAQQLLISSSHKIIDMGQVSVYACVAKVFCVTNNLDQHINVTIKPTYEELEQTAPISQIIPPRQTAGFNITFCSKKTQTFTKTVEYVINGHHTFSFNVSAHVVPIELSLSRQMIDFRFSPDSTDPVIKEFVTVQNKSNARAEISWVCPPGPFHIKHPANHIEPNKSINAEIQYRPGTKSRDEATIVLNVNGGQPKTLKLVGDVGSPKCSLSKKVISFGLIPIGIDKVQQLRIKNTSEDDAIFCVKIPKEYSKLQVLPMNGRVSARDSQNLQIVYKPTSATSFDIPVTISICGGSDMLFNVTGQAEIPEVHMTNTDFDFGRVFVGSSASMTATISNVGAIPAVLFLDLSRRPEFRIEFPTDLSESENANEQKNTISLVSDAFFVTKTAGVNDYMTAKTAGLALARTPTTTKERGEGGGLMYKIQLLEKTTIMFNLIFQPTKISEHSFELPISMMNADGAPAFHLQPIVSAEAVPTPLSLSKSSVDFGIAPIFDPENPNAPPVCQLVSISNETKEAVKWHFDTSNELFSDPEVFRAEPTHGELAAGSVEQVKLYFSPRNAMPYNAYLSCLVNSDDRDDCLVGQIQLTGVGTSQVFRPSVSEICLPVVPVGVKLQMELSILNIAAVSALLRIQMPVDENSCPLKVTFPEGNQLRHTTQKLPLVITFSSTRPVSFSTLIAIMDENGNAASFAVTCTADNSVFSLYPYLTTHSKEKGSDKIDKEYLESCELTARFSSTGDFIELKGAPNWAPSFPPLMASFFQRYLSALVLKSPMTEFPDDLIRDQGAIIMEAIASLTGSKSAQVNENDRTKTSQSSMEDPAGKRQEAMKKLIHNLQSMGALMSGVKPEFLLSRTDFMQIMRAKVTRQLLAIDFFNAPNVNTFDQKMYSEFMSSKGFSNALVERLKILESLYEALSMESWMILLMQMFKLFVIARVEVDRMNMIPGMADAMRALKQVTSKAPNGNEIMNELTKPLKSIQSPLMSVKEAGLLRWVAIHTYVVTGDCSRSFAGFDSLRDSVGFGALLKSHTTVYHSPTDASQKEQNAVELISAMKELRMAFCPLAKEICEGTPCMLATTLAYLYSLLPHYLPTTSIEFSAVMHKSVTKAVTLTNPSKSEIVYRASLEGDPAFSLVQESIVVGPGQTVDFPVMFSAKTVKPVAGRLSLLPSKPRQITQSDDSKTPQAGARAPQYSAPVVVDLISSVTVQVADTTIEAETQLYQPITIPVPVKNFLEVPAKMMIHMHVAKITDDKGVEVKDQKSLTQYVMQFAMNDKEEQKDGSKVGNRMQLEEMVKSHETFLLQNKTVDLDSAIATEKLEVEFVPIELGTYRLLLVFVDRVNGEFVYEVIAKSTLPSQSETTIYRTRSETGKRSQISIPVEVINQPLIRALVYATERASSFVTQISERKFRDALVKRQHDLELSLKQNFTSAKYSVHSSSGQFFEIASDFVIYKQSITDTLSTSSQKTTTRNNSVLVTFKPTKPGEYPCKIVLMGSTISCDIRCFYVKAVGVLPTKELFLEFSTFAGKSIKQDIPFNNPSDETWQYKVVSSGDSSFSIPARFTVKPQSQAPLTISFNSNKIGHYEAEMIVTNLAKDSTQIYKLSATVEEPPAEEKIVINCKARQKLNHIINVKPFIRNGEVHVTSTIPLIEFPKEFKIIDNAMDPPFAISLIAPRSGVLAGTLTFTDTVSKSYVWYIVEINVDSPPPEEVIEVSTVARQPVIVKIPISNPKQEAVKFNASLSDSDMTGASEFVLKPKESIDYVVTVSPFKAGSRTGSVYFYTEDGNEFWYTLKMNIEPPSENLMAPVTAPIGKSATVTIELVNSSPLSVTYRVENDNTTAWQLSCRRVLQLSANEKRKIVARYIPTTVGIKETACIVFKSNECGDWIYRVTGTGKPPQPLSPTIVSAAVNQANSALVLFTNPFPYASRFSVSLTSEIEGSEIFKFLVKRKIFSLNSYGEEFQIPFTFSPEKIGQFKASIIVASLGSSKGPLPELEAVPTIRWVYPIIGNSTATVVSDTRILKCRAGEVIEQKFPFTLVGETDSFDMNEYKIKLDVPNGSEFVYSALDFIAIGVERTESTSDLIVQAKFAPHRPLQTAVTLTIKNPLNQEWQFQIELAVDLGTPLSTIVVESLLNKVGKAKIQIPKPFHAQVPFHIYFMSGSAAEFSLTSEYGLIEPGAVDATEVPVEILFEPKIYGKILKGLLVIDTMDAQFLFDVVGKTPDYVPPVINKASIEARASPQMEKKRKRNIIRENIEGARIMRPKIEK